MPESSSCNSVLRDGSAKLLGYLNCKQNWQAEATVVLISFGNGTSSTRLRTCVLRLESAMQELKRQHVYFWNDENNCCNGVFNYDGNVQQTKLKVPAIQRLLKPGYGNGMDLEFIASIFMSVKVGLSRFIRNQLTELVESLSVIYK